MKISRLLLGAGMAMSLTAMAAPLTPEQALERAQGNCPARITAKGADKARLVYSAKSENGITGAYVFNNPGEGYVIVSADDVAVPVLGYSDSGSVNADNMSPELRWWLGEYTRRIEWAVENGVSLTSAQRKPNPEWQAISPLIKTKWNQDAPYNDECPTPRGGTQRCYTGCVATSMAQVMNYFKYPKVGEGIVSYTCESINRKLTMNFAQREFDWDNMLDTYAGKDYTAEQSAAVAYLMKACGYSVEMYYGTDASGAAGADVAPALRQYFKYDSNLQIRHRILYTGSQWEQMIYDNLKNIGPIVMNGQSPLQGGHSFVCDGYDGKGYFHFNWGWSGVSDGYYTLDALNPDAQGIGGYAGGFNFMQNAIIGIQPPTGSTEKPEEMRILQYGTTTATISDRTITFNVKDYTYLGWGSYAAEPVRFNIGAIVSPLNGQGENIEIQGKLGNMTELNVPKNSAFYAATSVKPTVTLPQLADGEYKVTLAGRQLGYEGASWLPVAVAVGYSNYCILTVKDGVYTVADVPVKTLNIADVQVLSPLYSTKNVLFRVKMANNNTEELDQGLCPHLCDASGKMVYQGESILVSLEPGETLEKEWVAKFLNSNGAAANVSKATDFTLRFFDPRSGRYYEDFSQPVQLLPSPGTTRVMLTGVNIENSERKEVTVLDRIFPAMMMVADPSDMNVDLSFRVTSGFYDGQISIDILQQDPANPAYGTIVVDDGVWSKYAFAGKGETINIKAPVSFTKAEAGVAYFIRVNYTLGTSLQTFGNVSFMKASTGIDDIEADAAPAEYYNLQGVRIAEPEAGQLVIERREGKSRKLVWK